MGFFTHEELVKAYRARPGRAADAAERHRYMAEAARQAGELNQAVHHWDRVDMYNAVLDELVACRRCGRPLTHPVSISRHIGPECLSKEPIVERCTICDGRGVIAAPDPIIGGTIDIECSCAAKATAR